eukprot:5067359-Amphidinium_carterae.2
MLRTFRGFCENNGLSTMLYNYMENHGTMKPQYVTGDNGIKHDHRQAMALHKWNRPEPAIYNEQHMSIRVGTPPSYAHEMQVTSGVTILHSSITMTVGNPNDLP